MYFCNIIYPKTYNPKISVFKNPNQRGADIAIDYVSNATAAEPVVEQIRALDVRALAP